MKWLLTIPADSDLHELRQEVEAAGATIENRDPVPLEGNERVVYADGPDDLHVRLSNTKVPVRLNRSSKIQLF